MLRIRAIGRFDPDPEHSGTNVCTPLSNAATKAKDDPAKEDLMNAKPGIIPAAESEHHGD